MKIEIEIELITLWWEILVKCKKGYLLFRSKGANKLYKKVKPGNYKIKPITARQYVNLHNLKYQ